MVAQLFGIVGDFIGKILSLPIPGFTSFTFLHLMVIGFILLFVGVIFRITIGGGGGSE